MARDPDQRLYSGDEHEDIPMDAVQHESQMVGGAGPRTNADNELENISKDVQYVFEKVGDVSIRSEADGKVENSSVDTQREPEISGNRGLCNEVGEKFENNSGDMQREPEMSVDSGLCSEVGKKVENNSGDMQREPEMSGDRGLCSEVGEKVENNSGDMQREPEMSVDSGLCSEVGEKVENNSGDMKREPEMSVDSGLYSEVGEKVENSCLDAQREPIVNGDRGLCSEVAEKVENKSISVRTEPHIIENRSNHHKAGAGHEDILIDAERKFNMFGKGALIPEAIEENGNVSNPVLHEEFNLEDLFDPKRLSQMHIVGNRGISFLGFEKIDPQMIRSRGHNRKIGEGHGVVPSSSLRQSNRFGNLSNQNIRFQADEDEDEQCEPQIIGEYSDRRKRGVGHVTPVMIRDSLLGQQFESETDIEDYGVLEEREYIKEQYKRLYNGISGRRSEIAKNNKDTTHNYPDPQLEYLESLGRPCSNLSGLLVTSMIVLLSCSFPIIHWPLIYLPRSVSVDDDFRMRRFYCFYAASVLLVGYLPMRFPVITKYIFALIFFILCIVWCSSLFNSL